MLAFSPFRIPSISKLAAASIPRLLLRPLALPDPTSISLLRASSSSDSDAAAVTDPADHASSSKKIECSCLFGGNVFHTYVGKIFLGPQLMRSTGGCAITSALHSFNETSDSFLRCLLGTLKSGLYLVATPIGNLEDITLRALRILKSADVILSEDTRHSWKLLHHYNIDTPLLSYHKFNESQREGSTLRRLHEGQVIALISDAGTPGISDPGFELIKVCTRENIAVIPIPGPSALVAALSACGLPTNEFTFVGFLPKHAGSRRAKLLNAANQVVTQIFFVPPHKLLQFLNEASSTFGDSRACVIAREMTKIHEEFWRGTLGEAAIAFSSEQPKGEITLLIEGRADSPVKAPSEDELENELRDLLSKGHSISTSVKIVAGGSAVKRKEVYTLALRLFAKHEETEELSDT